MLLSETATLNDRAGESGLSGKLLPPEPFSQLNYVMVIVKVELIAFIIVYSLGFLYEKFAGQKMLACEFEVWYKKRDQALFGDYAGPTHEIFS